MRAEHAMAGKYHLETNYDHMKNRWDWWARAVKSSSVPEFTGSATDLENAKKDACSSIGLAVQPTWIKIGPWIDIPD
jgi:hypothetical protein